MSDQVFELESLWKSLYLTVYGDHHSSGHLV
jgi:hypothetical protein